MTEVSATITEKFEYTPWNYKRSKPFFTFELASGETVELMVNAWIYMRYEIGDSGSLLYNGEKFVSFVLPPAEEEKKAEIDQVIANKKRMNYLYFFIFIIVSVVVKSENTSKSNLWFLFGLLLILPIIFNKLPYANLNKKKK